MRRRQLSDDLTADVAGAANNKDTIHKLSIRSTVP